MVTGSMAASIILEAGKFLVIYVLLEYITHPTRSSAI